jgi:hypothetical protein
VVTGLAWVTTNAPLDFPFVFSVRVISVFQFSPDVPLLSEFQSNRTSVLNSLRLGGFRLRRAYENELPQPHDFFAFGFRNSKPWCIRLSS